MNSLLLIIDVGTTSVKVVVFDSHGRPVSTSSAAYRTDYPHSGWAEQNPRAYWEAAVLAVRKLDLAGKSIAGIGVSGHMNGCLVVDADGVPTHPHIIHSDTRSTDECAHIVSLWGQPELYRRTKNRMDEHLSLPKLLWIKRNRQEAISPSAWFLNAKDYVRYRLTNKLGTTDYSDASLTGAFNQDTRTWDNEIIESLQLPLSIFPEVHTSTEIAGTLTGEAARLLGLSAGIPVAYGGGDASCATRGAGIMDLGQAYAAVGSSAWLSTLAKEPVVDSTMRMQHFYDLEGALCNVCGTVQSAGSALDWVRDLLLPSRVEGRGVSHDEVELLLDRIPIGSTGVLFLPYLMGERTPHWDAGARGAFIGLSLATDRETVLRATYEGISFALTDIMQVYTDLHIPIEHCKVLGGAARSRFWQQMLAETWGMPVTVHANPGQATALGCAYATGVAIGFWTTLREAITSTQQDEVVVYPDIERIEVYRRVYAVYRESYPALKGIYHQLVQLRDMGH